MEQQKQKTNNYVINRIDTALEAEEYKHLGNLLKPLDIVSATKGKLIDISDIKSITAHK